MMLFIIKVINLARFYLSNASFPISVIAIIKTNSHFHGRMPNLSDLYLKHLAINKCLPK